MTKIKTQERSLAAIPQPAIIKICLPGAVVPKARARVTRNGTYFPQRYQNWRKMAESSILVSLSLIQRVTLPIHRAEVRIMLQGKHRGDLDNLAGSCLDALVSSGVLLDDRLSCVPHLVISHKPEGSSGVWLEVIPM